MSRLKFLLSSFNLSVAVIIATAWLGIGAAIAGNFHCYVLDGRMICCTTTGNITSCQ